MDIDGPSDEEELLWSLMLTGSFGVDRAKYSDPDAAGVRHRYKSNEIRTANAETRGKRRMKLCPICCTPAQNPSAICANVNECSFTWKVKVPSRVSSLKGVVRAVDSGTEAQFGEARILQAIERITATYFDIVDIRKIRIALARHHDPCHQPSSYVFDEHSSADRLHCLPEGKVQSVLSHKDGLSPFFALMAPGQRIRGVWFREATIIEVAKGVKHTIEKHLKNNTNKTIYGFVVRQEHAASRLIVPAKHNHQFFSMVNIPTNELILVKLN